MNEKYLTALFRLVGDGNKTVHSKNVPNPGCGEITHTKDLYFLI